MWATFSATSLGAPFGAFFGMLGYWILLHGLPLRAIIRSVPLLFLATLLGALAGAPAGLAGQLLFGPVAFFIACAHFAQRYRTDASDGKAGTAQVGPGPA